MHRPLDLIVSRTLRSIALIAAGLVAAACSTAPIASAQETPVHDCDRLAANPPDPDRVVEGVPRAELDFPNAIAACEAAIEAYPNEGRFSYQLGRLLFYQDDPEGGIALWMKSAEDGYRQAYFLLGVVIDNRREGVEHDDCKLEAYWAQSARMGHVNARVGYLHHLLRGRFDGCQLTASADEMRTFLDVPPPPSTQYGMRLLLKDLAEDLEVYLKQ